MVAGVRIQGAPPRVRLEAGRPVRRSQRWIRLFGILSERVSVAMKTQEQTQKIHVFNKIGRTEALSRCGTRKKEE